VVSVADAAWMIALSPWISMPLLPFPEPADDSIVAEAPILEMPELALPVAVTLLEEAGDRS
jgi:hypothetical protein